MISIVDNIRLQRCIYIPHISSLGFKKYSGKEDISDLSEEELSDLGLDVSFDIFDIHYSTFINNIWISYYPNTQSLIISGSLKNYLIKNKLYIKNNFDLNCDIFINKFNYELNKKIPDYNLNIGRFHLLRIDYHYDYYTEYVNEYIKFYNLCFQNINRYKKVDYKNYVLETGKALNSSFYVKTKGQYDKTKKQSYAINFYNKELELIEKGKPSKGYENILRYEVQCHYDLIRSICKEYDINFEKRCLKDFLRKDIAKSVIIKKIKLMFGTNDFLSFKYAQKLLLNESENTDMMDFIYKLSRNNNIDNSMFIDQCDVLLKKGIFPYGFIDKHLNLEKLENPIKLIELV